MLYIEKNHVEVIFRDEHQTPEGEAVRNKDYQFVSAWEYKGEPKDANIT